MKLAEVLRHLWPIHNSIVKVNENNSYLDDTLKRVTIEPGVTDYLGCSTRRKVAGRKYGTVIEAWCLREHNVLQESFHIWMWGNKAGMIVSIHVVVIVFVIQLESSMLIKGLKESILKQV